MPLTLLLLAAACAGGNEPTSAFSAVPGNSISVPLPSDVPAQVANLAALPSCGGETLFEQDVDLSPIPTAPGPTTPASANDQANNCLISAWENGRPAQLWISSISDEADEIFTIYRLPGNAMVDVITRVRSHSDRTIQWMEVTCKQLSLQGDDITPAGCGTESLLP